MSLLKLMQCLGVSPPPVALCFAHLYLSVGIPTTERKVGPAEQWWMGHAKKWVFKTELAFQAPLQLSSHYILFDKVIVPYYIKLSFVNLNRYLALFNTFSVVLKALSCLEAILNRQILKYSIFLPIVFSVKLSLSTLFILFCFIFLHGTYLVTCFIT